jgi:hypothetical protein
VSGIAEIEPRGHETGRQGVLAAASCRLQLPGGDHGHRTPAFCRGTNLEPPDLLSQEDQLQRISREMDPGLLAAQAVKGGEIAPGKQKVDRGKRRPRSRIPGDLSERAGRSMHLPEPPSLRVPFQPVRGDELLSPHVFPLLDLGPAA